MKIEVYSDADAAATAGAKFIAALAREAVAARGRFVMAVSGGRVPWQMFRLLPNETVPWKNVHLVQVDERVAPADDPDRNLTHLRESLLSRVPLPPGQFHAMPVEENDLEAAAASYANCFRRLPVRRQCWTSCISDLDRTATRRHSCQAIQFLTSLTATLR
jgi:6-phosphogluconolactonase/glucosamine-6-phosphate isomerase/deaminase